MGGPGSGYRHSKKKTVEDCLTLDINKLVRDSLIRPDIVLGGGTLTWTNTATGEKVSTAGFWVSTNVDSDFYFRLVYLIKSSGEDVDHRFPLETTAFTRESLTAIPSLTPDVALVHAQRADEQGDVQMWGVLGDTVVGALASRRIIVTVEEIVSRDLVRDDPNRTVIPGYRVDAVCVASWGAHPSYVQGYYGRDDSFYRSYDQFSRSREGLAAYLNEWVFGVANRSDYIAKLDTGPLGVPSVTAPPISYGFDRR